MKKVLSGLIMVAVLIASLSAGSITVSASENSKASLSVSKVTAKPGDEAVVVELALSGKKIAGFQGKLMYNADSLTLKKIEQTNLLSNGLTMFDQDKESGEFLSGSFAYASAKGIDVNETVIKFTFWVKASTANAVYALKLEEVKVYDQGIKDVEASVSDGSITVGSGGTVVNPTSNAPTETNDNPSPSGDGNTPDNSPNPDGGENTETSNDTATTTDGTEISSGPADGTESTSTDIGLETSSPAGILSPDNNLLLILIGALVVVAIGCVVAVVLINRKKKSKGLG